VIALWIPSAGPKGEPVASQMVSFVKDIEWLDITKFGALALFVFVVMAMSNAVNLTDGLDGLATGTSVMVIGSYGLIAFWE
jgi:phospho-N-acetylmuramoyl-pentapeptide-transferase